MFFSRNCRALSLQFLKRKIGVPSASGKSPVTVAPRTRFRIAGDPTDVMLRPRVPSQNLMKKSEMRYLQNLREQLRVVTASRGANPSAAADLMTQCLADFQLVGASYLVSTCVTEGVSLEGKAFSEALERFSSHYMFDAASLVAIGLLKSGTQDVDSAAVSLALNGSANTGSMKLALDLLIEIIERRRYDLIEQNDLVDVYCLLPCSSRELL